MGIIKRRHLLERDVWASSMSAALEEMASEHSRQSKSPWLTDSVQRQLMVEQLCWEAIVSFNYRKSACSRNNVH